MGATFVPLVFLEITLRLFPVSSSTLAMTLNVQDPIRVLTQFHGHLAKAHNEPGGCYGNTTGKLQPGTNVKRWRFWRRPEAALAVQSEFPQGVPGVWLELVSDNRTQSTLTGFKTAMNAMDLEHEFASDDNPKGNAEPQRLMRAIKEELLWEGASLEKARAAIRQWIMVDYNQRYAQSCCQSPLEFEAALNEQEAAQAAA